MSDIDQSRDGLEGFGLNTVVIDTGGPKRSKTTTSSLLRAPSEKVHAHAHPDGATVCFIDEGALEGMGESWQGFDSRESLRPSE